MEENILHQDCSLNNMMIEDFKGSSCGLLLDWEFSIEVNEQYSYNVGGTVSYQNVSVSLAIMIHCILLGAWCHSCP